MQKIKLPIKNNESTPTNPDLKWGGKMLGIFLLFIIISYIIFLFFSKIILANLSLETEKKWFWEITLNNKFDYTEYTDYKIEEFNNYNFNLEDNDKVNAYAFLGWNINITTWFLKNIENQEELVFVMAHEMWHIKNRDILKAYTTDIPLKLTLLTLWIDIWVWDTSFIDMWWKYLNKNTEIQADIAWLDILEKYNINPLCAKIFFERDHNFSDSVMEMMSDHPLNNTRILLMDELAKKMWYKNADNCKKLKNIIY